MIAMSILGIGLFGAIRVFPVGLRASQRAKWASRAALVGSRTMESLKLKPWDQLAAGSSAGTEDVFAVKTTIDQPVIAGLVDPTRVKRLTVTVSWDQEGRARSFVLVSLIHRSTS